jgi:hypothetical protein
MYELDRRRQKQSVKKLTAPMFQVIETNGHNCIVQDETAGFWMSVPVKTGVDLYPMKII